ncbi:hypothetical protein PGTUg99_005147 [Puccinia graminis f. sp. tritici]|uniref:Uncharacterized protein n=1 Tax=Puccinia graminis f. sp. tritici TaxID=56615 RepID=A0A5B0PD76_PUCGR|nr:hypothetical protein PGTUg99_005147 [Puccinia graminis f. sp. tritici]
MSQIKSDLGRSQPDPDRERDTFLASPVTCSTSISPKAANLAVTSTQIHTHSRADDILPSRRIHMKLRHRDPGACWSSPGRLCTRANTHRLLRKQLFITPPPGPLSLAPDIVMLDLQSTGSSTTIILGEKLELQELYSVALASRQTKLQGGEIFTIPTHVAAIPL